jgi:anthraniloyl-CoA monooxygenase
VTVPRALLVTALANRCEQSGIRLQFHSDAARFRPSDFDGFDLVVAADGAHSAVRWLYGQAFGPLVTLSRNFYGWFGANVPLQKLTIMLADTEGVMLAWGYKYTASLSTLIVECSDRTMSKVGLDRMSNSETASTIGNVFARDLGGAIIDCGSSARWMRFPTVTCRRLRHNHIVLIGDAGHTTHFSQGFGTMFAFDDAIALRSAFATTKDVEEALGLYESTQLPKIALFQEIAQRSMKWSETLIEMTEKIKPEQNT